MFNYSRPIKTSGNNSSNIPNPLYAHPQYISETHQLSQYQQNVIQRNRENDLALLRQYPTDYHSKNSRLMNLPAKINVLRQSHKVEQNDRNIQSCHIKQRDLYYSNHSFVNTREFRM